MYGGDGRVECVGDLVGVPAEHVTEEQYGTRFRLEMLQCGDEHEPNAVTRRDGSAGSGSGAITRRSGIGVTQTDSSTDGPRSLSPDDGGARFMGARAGPVR